MKRITVTDEELQQLGEFLDLGVRAQGIKVAAAALQLISRLQAAEDLPEVPVDAPAQE